MIEFFVREDMLFFVRFFFILFLLQSDFISASSNNSSKITKYEGTIMSCHDGDTCKVQTKDRILKVRLFGIDAPELKQKEGLMAKRYLEKLILTKTVDLECDGKSYDRITCTVFLNEININEKMAIAGMALDSPKYSKGIYKLQMLKAKSDKLGIWKTLDRSPKCFRHKNKFACQTNPMEMN